MLSDYVNQGARFAIQGGFGCGTAEDGSILDTVIAKSWTVVPPLVSVTLYYRESASDRRLPVLGADDEA